MGPVIFDGRCLIWDQFVDVAHQNKQLSVAELMIVFCFVFDS
jgi:hypothetical protein